MRSYELAGNLVRVYSHQAMATIFETHIAHPDRTYAAQACQAAFSELNIIENDLSRFQEQSDIVRINRLKKGQSTVVSPHTFNCVKKAIYYFKVTNAVFDIGLGKEIERLKNKHDLSEISQPAAHNLAGLKLNDLDLSVELVGDEINLDLGGIGKGYALDYLKNLFDDWDLNCILIQGGRSTALALKAPGDLSGWPVSISHPRAPYDQINAVNLANGALSSSGVRKGTHIVDPRSPGSPLANQAVWVLTSNAIDSDILSTTFLIFTFNEIKKFCHSHPETAYLVIDAQGKIHRHGL